MTVTLYLIKLIDVRKNTNEHRILYKIVIVISKLNEKAKTTNNGSVFEAVRNTHVARECLDLIKHVLLVF